MAADAAVGGVNQLHSQSETVQDDLLGEGDADRGIQYTQKVRGDVQTEISLYCTSGLFADFCIALDFYFQIPAKNDNPKGLQPYGQEPSFPLFLS